MFQLACFSFATKGLKMLLAGRYASLQVAFPEPLTQLLCGGIIAGGFWGYPHFASKCYWLSLGEDE